MSDPAPETDLQLLARYARDHAEEAFTALVRRHVNLVYSAALRQVRSPQLAEEVAQSTFTDLVRNTSRLLSDRADSSPNRSPAAPALGSLTPWLYQVTRRTAIDVVRREARRQLREQIATELHTMNATPADWAHIEPLLDDAMSALDDTDRTAVLLRYFENQTLREVGATLGISDDAAQKRVSRAVERLREIFAKRGVTVCASGLAVVISANAVQAAPVGMALTITTAAALTGATLATTATVTKAIAMTTLQKTLVTATLAVLAGAGIYEARQASHLREQNQTLRQHQAPLVEQVQQLQHERDNAMNQLAELAMANSQLKTDSDRSELLKLRGEVGVLRRRNRELEEVATGAGLGLEQRVSSTNFLAKESWEFAGFDTPEGALRTCFWAQSSGYANVWLACLGNSSLDMVEAAKRAVGQGQINAERTQRLIDATAKWTGIQILKVVPISNHDALVQFELLSDVDGQTDRHVTLQEMKKIHGIWKVCNSYAKDP